jgi:hypothetical protein
MPTKRIDIQMSKSLLIAICQSLHEGQSLDGRIEELLLEGLQAHGINIQPKKPEETEQEQEAQRGTCRHLDPHDELYGVTAEMAGYEPTDCKGCLRYRKCW